MSKNGYICVFDCETIPDVALLERVMSEEDVASCKNGDEIDKKALSELAFTRQTEASGSSFLPVCFHEVVAISAVMSDSFGRFRSVNTIEGTNEEEIIRKFIRFIEAHNPRLVSFNGRGFDLPMIMARALKYNISAPSYFCVNDRENGKDKWTNYRSRYDGVFHLDLLDHIGDFGAVRGLKLDTLCASVGLPGKYDVHGDQVLELYYAGERDKIDEYCESDVLNTYWLFLKYELLRGNLTIEDYADYISLMSEYLNTNKAQMSYTPVFCEYIKNELEKVKKQ